MKRVGIILVHGGAGHRKTDKTMNLLHYAAEEGVDALSAEKKAIDAVERTVRFLEDSGEFNAGVGSTSQSDGIVRMDAGIMDGSTLRCGAVAALQNIQNPISVARRIMETTSHILLTGDYALRFATRQGFPRLHTSSNATSEGDTVGAVALDREGRLAAGCSTGGIGRTAMPGRVGDCAVVGSGFYAHHKAAAVATGLGEAIMRVTLCVRACSLVEGGLTSQESADNCIRYLEEKTGGTVGILVIDSKGKNGVSFNSRSMPWVQGEA